MIARKPRAWESSVSWRVNQLLSAAQYDNCLPKTRVDFDVPLFDQSTIDAAERDTRYMIENLSMLLGKCAYTLKRTAPDHPFAIEIGRAHV